ncbi:MAG: NgoFVII family restriction endonuclease [bacterium]|nr:NgoFVII family restriction endonuclease [bacterium]
MPLLFSNLSPLKTAQKSYADVFRHLIEKSHAVNIATGYISTDSLVDLKNIVEANNGPAIDLCVGMHFFEGLTLSQMEALTTLNDFLRDKNLGQVRMVVTFPFHGKIASFSENGKLIGSIIGSSNLSNILDSQRQYEADFLLEDESDQKELKDFLERLADVSSTPLEELKNVRIIEPKNDLLNDQIGVSPISAEDLNSSRGNLSNISFEIPLKGDESQRSGLNASFGEGRRNLQGFVVPRSWYEVELIVPKAITGMPGYPRADASGDTGCLDAITDDGWKFRCKVSGDYSKNFRSENDLKILGRWMKGRMENAGSLKPGSKVTDKTLEKYGRSTLTLTKMNDGKWFIDFGVR